MIKYNILKDKKGAEGAGTLISGIILLIIFGLLIPTAMSSLNLNQNTSSNSTMKTIGNSMAQYVQEGFPVHIPGLGIIGQSNSTCVNPLGCGNNITFGQIENSTTQYNGFLGNGFIMNIPTPFGLIPSIQSWLSSDFRGIGLYPDIIGIPVILIIAILIIYGLVKLAPG